MSNNKVGIFSRVISVFLLSFPLSYAMHSFSKSDLAKYNTYTHEQLLIYLKEGIFTGFLENWLMILFLGGFIYWVMEIVAYAIRYIHQKATKQVEI